MGLLVTGRRIFTGSSNFQDPLQSREIAARIEPSDDRVEPRRRGGQAKDRGIDRDLRSLPNVTKDVCVNGAQAMARSRYLKRMRWVHSGKGVSEWRRRNPSTHRRVRPLLAYLHSDVGWLRHPHARIPDV